MFSVDAVLRKIEILDGGKTAEVIKPQIKKFYRDNGQWYAQVALVIGGNTAYLHVAMGN